MLSPTSDTEGHKVALTKDETCRKPIATDHKKDNGNVAAPLKVLADWNVWLCSLDDILHQVHLNIQQANKTKLSTQCGRGTTQAHHSGAPLRGTTQEK